MWRLSGSRPTPCTSACARAWPPPGELRRLFARTVCTKLLAVARCRLRAPESLPDALHRMQSAVRWAGDSAVAADIPVKGAAVVGGGGGFKWPSLEDAVRCLLWCSGGDGQGAAGFRSPAHDARGDVERCRDVLLACVRHDAAAWDDDGGHVLSTAVIKPDTTVC